MNPDKILIGVHSYYYPPKSMLLYVSLTGGLKMIFSSRPRGFASFLVEFMILGPCHLLCDDSDPFFVFKRHVLTGE